MLNVSPAGLWFAVKLPPISKKNSQQILNNPRTGKPFIMPSKKYKEYEKAALWFIPKGETINRPVNVKCLFYMPTRRKCDLVNMQEAILDVMVKAGLLADDNFSIVQSMDGSRVLYDKEHPRTEVYIQKYATAITRLTAKNARGLKRRDARERFFTS
jgi:Holliday junction resolvase RusA-like endonuclease